MPGSKFELKMNRCTTTIDLTSYPMQTDRKSDSKFKEKVHKNHVPAHRISKKNKADIIDTLWICNHFQSINRSLQVFAETHSKELIQNEHFGAPNLTQKVRFRSILDLFCVQNQRAGRGFRKKHDFRLEEHSETKNAF